MKVLDTGIVYRNPAPHLTSRHAYFPSLVSLSGDAMIASYTIGEAFEAVNLHTEVSRSEDGGLTWESLGRTFTNPDPDSNGQMCEASRITALPDGTIVALVAQFDRSAHPDRGLSNEETLGLVDTTFLISRSADEGRTWSSPAPVATPLVGPSFELCSPIFVHGKRWLFATSTWRRWDGHAPNGMKMVMLESDDNGMTWPRFTDVMADADGKRIFWESKVVPLADGRWVAVAWVFNEKQGKDEENHFAVSDDEGRTWSNPQATGLVGQTMTPLALPDGRMFFTYRRIDKPGLWAGISNISGDVWNTGDLIEIWNGGSCVTREGTADNTAADTATDTAAADAAASDMVEAFQNLRFGAPTVINHPDGSIFLAFWAYEDCVSVIRWIKISI